MLRFKKLIWECNGRPQGAKLLKEGDIGGGRPWILLPRYFVHLHYHALWHCNCRQGRTTSVTTNKGHSDRPSK